MAFLTCSFSSEVLKKSVQFNAIIPRGCEKGSRVLYLLHGLSDDYTAWMRFSSIERYANEAGIVVIMPDAARSFYTDMIGGPPYYTFFQKEFIPYVTTLFSLQADREHTYIAGLSMGGYGAIKLAFLNPDIFSAAASLSGAVDIVSRMEKDPRLAEAIHLVFGPPSATKNTSNDLFYLAKNPIGASIPRLYIACGTEDFLYQDNLRFRDVLSTSSYPFRFECGQGIHDWNFWDTYIKKAISFFLRSN